MRSQQLTPMFFSTAKRLWTLPDFSKTPWYYAHLKVAGQCWTMTFWHFPLKICGDPNILVGNKPPPSETWHKFINIFSGLYPTYGHFWYIYTTILGSIPKSVSKKCSSSTKKHPKKSAATLRQVEGSAQGALCAAQPFRVAGAFWQDPPHGCRRSFVLSFLKIHIEIIDL